MRSSVMSCLLIGTIWLLTACIAMPESLPSSSSTDRTEQFSSVVVETIKSEARLESKIAHILNLEEDSVTIRNVELVDWPDSCMGLPQTDELCAQVITPGFKAIAETPQGKYVLSGDRNHHNFRLMMQSIETP